MTSSIPLFSTTSPHLTLTFLSACTCDLMWPSVMTPKQWPPGGRRKHGGTRRLDTSLPPSCHLPSWDTWPWAAAFTSWFSDRNVWERRDIEGKGWIRDKSRKAVWKPWGDVVEQKVTRVAFVWPCNTFITFFFTKSPQGLHNKKIEEVITKLEVTAY